MQSASCFLIKRDFNFPILATIRFVSVKLFASAYCPDRGQNIGRKNVYVLFVPPLLGLAVLLLICFYGAFAPHGAPINPSPATYQKKCPA